MAKNLVNKSKNLGGYKKGGATEKASPSAIQKGINTMKSKGSSAMMKKGGMKKKK